MEGISIDTHEHTHLHLRLLTLNILTLWRGESSSSSHQPWISCTCLIFVSVFEIFFLIISKNTCIHILSVLVRWRVQDCTGEYWMKKLDPWKASHLGIWCCAADCLSIKPFVFYNISKLCMCWKGAFYWTICSHDFIGWCLHCIEAGIIGTK